MSLDFTTARLRRHVLAHARQVEKALKRKGVDSVPEELSHLFEEDDGSLSAVVDAGLLLFAKVLGVELEHEE